MHYSLFCEQPSCHGFCSLWLLYTMISFPFSPSRTSPSFNWTLTLPFLPRFPLAFVYSPLTSHLLLTWLLQPHVTMHVPAIANPNIAKVMRLASLLLSSSTPSCPLTTPIETYTWLAYTPRHSLLYAHSGIAHHNTKSRCNSSCIPISQI